MRSIVGLGYDLVGSLDFCRKVKWRITNEKAAVVNYISIVDVADDLVIKMADHLVAREATAGQHAQTDPGFTQRGEDTVPVRSARRVEHQGEAEA